MSHTESEVKLATLEFKKESLKADILLLYQLSIKLSLDANSATDEFEVRCTKLDDNFDKFMQIQNDLVELQLTIDPNTDLSTNKDEVAELKQYYYAILAFKKNLQAQNNSQNQSLTSDTVIRSTQVKLPKIQLPSFSGQLKEWPHFKDLYSSLIHDNQSLTDIEKFQYLLSCLTKEPHNLAKTLPVTGQNYSTVWNQLIDRYDNKRLLANCYLDEILNFPSITIESPVQLRQLLDTCSENATALHSIDFPVDLGDFIIMKTIVQKLDKRSRHLFESKHSKNEFPTFEQLMIFLRDHCKALDASQLNQSTNKVTFDSTKVSRAPFNLRFAKNELKPRNPVAFVGVSEPSNCTCCNSQAHNVYNCPTFKEKTPSERYQLIASLRKCTNCLGNHQTRFCKSKHTCRECFKPHHSLLHFSKAVISSRTSENSTNQIGNNEQKCSKSTELISLNHSNATPPPLTSDVKSTSLVCGNISLPHHNTTVLLATTLVSLTSPTSGTTHVFRGIVDCASQCSFLSEHAAQILRMDRMKSHLSIDGISGVNAKTKGLTHVNIKTLNGTIISLKHPVLILDKISSMLPRVEIHPDVVCKARKYVLADPTFNLCGPIDFLVGCDLFTQIFTGEIHPLGNNLPSVVGTAFGFVVLGKAPSIATYSNENPSSHLTTLLTCNDTQLQNTLQRFWQIEEPPQASKLSPDELYCENHFIQTHSRDETGRYIVRLPFKPDHSKLGNSYNVASQRMSTLEKRFKLQPELKRRYVEFMNDYTSSGHMKQSEVLNMPHSPSEEHYYLPHHGVVKESSSTTKLRVVFDASAQTSSQISLNNIILPGPKLQTNITDLLITFRCFNVVFTCDIRQMYRQIKVHEEDQRYQLILWRNNLQEPMSTFQLTTVTYGMNCSPFLAIRTLHQLAVDEGHNYPEAAEILRTQTFVDDIIAGGNSNEDALQLQEQLIALLARGGFELRKWTSNSSKLLEQFPKEELEVPIFSHENEVPSHFKILGLNWSSSCDSFSYKVDTQNKLPKPTKRQVLSSIAKIYDPVGFLSPVVMKAKCFMQHMWTEKMSWDDILPPHLIDKWNQFVDELPCLSKLQIPRPLQLDKRYSVQLHGFADASMHGYACVVFLRHITEQGDVVVKQIISKTRLAPLKTVTLPRLELCGSHLLAKVMKYCVSILSSHCNIAAIYNWSDSTIALSWIATPPHQLKTFVSNRVAEIQELTPTQSWRHISSTDNPADCASRGLSPSQLLNHDLWWNGPQWLKECSESWPKSISIIPDETASEELKNEPLTILVSASREEWNLLTKYSSWFKLLRVMAYILRFKYNCAHAIKKTGRISLKELQEATLCIIRLIQATYFKEDISLIQSNQNCSTYLRRLNAFVDSDGILRVGGRLGNSELKPGSKHPAILPKKHHVVDLLIDFYHIHYLHVGPQQLQALISQKFWIISARSCIRSRLHRCLTCFRCKPSPETPLMGNLPKARVTPSRPFNSTGCDYAGPFMVKLHCLRRIQPVKIYLCIFICFSTKAVHIETVTDLTSDAFIAALHRFVSRRGLVSHIYSDCGTNFVGASNQLKSLFTKMFQQPESRLFAEQRQIEFHFLPPSAPHQGGLWERAVRSAKYHLKRVIGDQILTLEEFMTLSSRVEAMLNSRPLTPLSADPNELDVLTPGHFLVGGPLITPLEEDLSTIKLNRLRRWQMVQNFTQRIWSRWQKEYLFTLQERPKWFKKNNNLDVGQLVLVHEANVPPMSWKLGRIILTHPGSDGIVRVVTLKTQDGIIKRPVVKLSSLPDQ